jgi:hypothetical protein
VFSERPQKLCNLQVKGRGIMPRQKRRPKMSKRKYSVRAECPACACGDVSFLGPEKLREKFIGNEEEVDILCPHCGTKIKGKVEIEEE